MKNKIEEEYKKIKKQETPELWSRIEARIDIEEAKEENRKENEKLKNVSYSSDIPKKKIGKKQIAAMSGVAAVIVVLLLALPLVSKRIKFYNNSVDGIMEVPTDSEEKYEMDTKDSKNAESDLEQEQIIQSDESSSKDIKNSTTESRLEPSGSIELKKISEVTVDSLKKINASDLPANIQEELKALLNDYDTCKFYKNKKQNIYILRKKILYLVVGVTL